MLHTRPPRHDQIGRRITPAPAAGIWLVVLSALLFAIGDWWAAPLLVVAAVLFWAMFYVLRIVQG
jgi:fatty acid desaturase